MEGWLTLNGAKALFAAAGLDFAQLKAAALRRDFHPIPLGARADFTVENTVREVASRNVVAKLEGLRPGASRRVRDLFGALGSPRPRLAAPGRPDLPRRARQRLGLRRPPGTGAGLRGAARRRPGRGAACCSSPSPLRRRASSVRATTRPIRFIPLAKTLADINMDGFNVFGRTDDFESVGLGASTLDDIAADITHAQGRYMVAELHPEWGSYYRSDHFEFAKVGVPACHMEGGWHFTGHPEDYGRQIDPRLHDQRLPQGDRRHQARLEDGRRRAGRGRPCSNSGGASPTATRGRPGSRATSSRPGGTP